MKDKKIVITVDEDGELTIELTRISNNFEILGMLTIAVENIKYLIEQDQK
jgi:hypothetical protein